MNNIISTFPGLIYSYRMLLWHGSQLTNWVGIISQGLRIAPPEAPVTGYMVSNIVAYYFFSLSWLQPKGTGFEQDNNLPNPKMI